MSSTHSNMRRSGAWGATLGALILLAMPTAAPAAEAPPPPPPPKPAKAEFPADFTVPMDAERGYRLGGFGGQAGAQPSHVPVIFVHGNTEDACGWKLIRDDFRAAGWNDQSLWALSYNGVGAGQYAAPTRPDPRCAEELEAQGTDGVPRITSNEVNVPDLHAFILAVRDYTGSKAFSLVGHSLGVTLARRTLQKHPELRPDLVAFVGIAGGNQGTSLCPPGSEKAVPVCAEVAPGSPWLTTLNGADGTDETWPPAQWMTVYDGSGEGDLAYRGEFAQSPALKGADNRQFPGVAHNDLRVLPEIVTVYREFLEQASAEHQAGQRPCHHQKGR